MKKIKFDLVSNFFSFGEMKKETFYNYFDHEIISKSNSIYLVNRFVSSPFFEPTYQNTLNVFDYEKKNFKTTYFDVFPIHHYRNFYRSVLGSLDNQFTLF